MNKQKLQLNRVGRPEGGAPTPCNDNRAHYREEMLLFLDTQPMKGHGLFVYYRSPNFLFLSIKVFSFPCYMETCMWLSMIADPELQFSGDPRKSIFAGEIPGRLFVSGEQHRP